MNNDILVVEDDPITQRMIAVNLERAGHQVRCTASVAEAELSIAENVPGLVLLDWMLPKTTGVSLIRKLRFDQRTRDVPVIMLTSRGLDSDKVTGLESGADDYVTKPFSPRELLARIKAVIRRRAPQASDDLVEVAGLRIDPLLKRVSAGDLTFEPGAIEFRMLMLFATHPGRVFSREILLDKLWGDNVFVQDRTVDAHIRALRQTLRPSGHDVLIETIRGEGYCFRRELPDPAIKSDLPRSDAKDGRRTPFNAREPGRNAFQKDFFAEAGPASLSAEALPLEQAS